jgi:hypothetical protein
MTARNERHRKVAPYYRNIVVNPAALLGRPNWRQAMPGKTIRQIPEHMCRNLADQRIFSDFIGSSTADARLKGRERAG